MKAAVNFTNFDRGCVGFGLTDFQCIASYGLDCQMEEQTSNLMSRCLQKQSERNDLHV